jgi:hypothetical protein
MGRTTMRAMRWFGRTSGTWGLALALVVGCGGGQKQQQPQPKPNAQPAPTPTMAQTAPPPQPTAPPTTTAALAPPGKYTTEIVIHQAEIHGKVKLKAGKKLLVEPLVATSQTSPQKGNKAEIFRVIGKQGAESDWLLIAEGEVGETWTAGSGKNVEVTVLDEKKDALVNGKPAFHFAPGTMVRVRWQW